MKAIIEIELEIDGEWRPADKDRLLDLIMSNPQYLVWTVEEDRLNVFGISMTVEIAGE